MQGRVRSRLEDDEWFSSSIRALASTEMSTEFVEKLLQAVPDHKPWAIGEALAECVLADEDTRKVHWPWNTKRDLRTPKGSLPGADLVGFCEESDKVLLLFGEVKTSSDSHAPPGVMTGQGGMAWQLTKISTRLDIQHSLILWLLSRSKDPEHDRLCKAALGRYIKSCGKEFLLVGVLLRDTQPDELDVSSPVKSLSNKLPAPTRVEVTAWYLPIPIDEWATAVYGVNDDD